jgi:hypothetical protein
MDDYDSVVVATGSRRAVIYLVPAVVAAVAIGIFQAGNAAQAGRGAATINSMRKPGSSRKLARAFFHPLESTLAAVPVWLPASGGATVLLLQLTTPIGTRPASSSNRNFLRLYRINVFISTRLLKGIDALKKVLMF